MPVTFYYPDAVTPTTTLVLPSPRAGWVPGGFQSNDNSFLTDGGQRFVYGKGVNKRYYKGDFVITSQAVFDAFVSFFETQAVAMQNTFSVALPSGSTIDDVRFNHNTIRDRIAQHKTGKHYTVSFELEADA